MPASLHTERLHVPATPWPALGRIATQLPCFLDLTFIASGTSGLRRFVRENLWIQDHQGRGRRRQPPFKSQSSIRTLCIRPNRQKVPLRPPRPTRFWFYANASSLFSGSYFQRSWNQRFAVLCAGKSLDSRSRGGGGGSVGHRSNRNHHSHAVLSTKSAKFLCVLCGFGSMPTQVPCFLDFAHKIFNTIDLWCFVPESLWIQDHQGEGVYRSHSPVATKFSASSASSAVLVLIKERR